MMLLTAKFTWQNTQDLFTTRYKLRMPQRSYIVRKETGHFRNILMRSYAWQLNSACNITLGRCVAVEQQNGRPDINTLHVIGVSDVTACGAGTLVPEVEPQLVDSAIGMCVANLEFDAVDRL